MHPIYYTIGAHLPLMIIPDTQAHLDGHTIITRTYHIYRHEPDPAYVQAHESVLGVDNNNDPNYMGYLTFDVPGRVYSYVTDGKADLSHDEIEEVIEHLNHYRDNPRLWPT